MNNVDMPWQEQKDRLGSNIEKKFKKEIPLFLQLTEFLITQCRISRGKLQVENLLDPLSRFVCFWWTSHTSR